MRIITAAEIAGALTYGALVDALADAFRSDITVPLRHHHPIPQVAGEPEAMLLLMPAWTPPGDGAFVGTKLVSVYPGNGARGLPSIYGSYVLCNGETGAPLAILDGTMLTVWRTACASALASRFLSRKDASSMVMVGAGALAPHLIRAHAAVRPIRNVACGTARARRPSPSPRGWAAPCRVSPSRSPPTFRRRWRRRTSSAAPPFPPSPSCPAPG